MDQRSAFHEALARLEALHDCQVSELAAEVAKLRGELEGRGPQADLSPGFSSDKKEEPDQVSISLPKISGSLDGQSSSLPRKSLSLDDKLQELDVAGTAPGRRHSKISWNLVAHELRAEVFQARRASVGRRVTIAYSQYNAAIGQQTQGGWRATCQKLVEREQFNIIMGLVIIANLICIGIEASFSRAGHQIPLAMVVLEYCFLSVYVVELGIRFGAHGIVCALRSSNWTKFDLFLVLVGIIDIVVQIAPMGGSGTLQVINKVFLVRILRLVRLVRVFRLMTKFHVLWMLIQGLLNSLQTLIWTAAMIFTLLYVFAVLGLEVLLPDPAADEHYNTVVATHFGNLATTMLALLQGISLDSFNAIYRPLVLSKPLTILYFAPFMLIVPIALMSLVTALMVNGALDQNARDKQEQEERRRQKKAAMVDLLKEMFHELDVDGSGRIDLQEMLAAPEQVRSLIFEIAELPSDPKKDNTRELKEIFDVMDFDGSGDVEVDEFCEGLAKIQDGQALETLRIMKQCTQICGILTDKTFRNFLSRVRTHTTSLAPIFHSEAPREAGQAPEQPRQAVPSARSRSV